MRKSVKKEIEEFGVDLSRTPHSKLRRIIRRSSLSKTAKRAIRKLLNQDQGPTDAILPENTRFKANVSRNNL